MNPYEILGVTNTATQDEIKSAYRKLSKQYHPDLNPGNSSAEEKFKEIGQAYDLIKDGKIWRPAQNKNSVNQSWQVDVNDFQSIFSDMFNGFNSPIWQHQPINKNKNTNIEIPISLKESIMGVKKIVNLKSQNNIVKQIEIDIPAGLGFNARINYPNQGLQTNPNFPPGDLTTLIKVILPKNYTFENGNLYCHTNISVWQAILGGKIQIQNPVEQTIEINIPQDIENSQILRIKNQGIFNSTLKQNQDLFLVLNIQMPKLTLEQKDQIKNLNFIKGEHE